MNICVSASVCISPAFFFWLFFPLLILTCLFLFYLICVVLFFRCLLIPKGDEKEWVWMRGEGGRNWEELGEGV